METFPQRKRKVMNIIINKRKPNRDEASLVVRNERKDTCLRLVSKLILD